MNQQRVSVIIVTLKREQAVCRLLHVLSKQTDLNFDVIIVEQVDTHQKVFTTIAKNVGLQCHYEFFQNANTPKARNIGLKSTQSEIVLFLDDDSYPDATWVACMKKQFIDDSISGVVGRVITPGQKNEPKRNDTGRIRWDGSLSDGFSSEVFQSGITAAIGCNMGFRRLDVEKIGLFDEQFTGNAMREDSDVSYRISKAGGVIVFAPEAVVTHMREPTGGARKADGRLDWYFHYFSNETYFFLKHFPVGRIGLLFVRLLPSALRCMFGFGREVSSKTIMLPFRGISDGFRKYNTGYDHRN